MKNVQLILSKYLPPSKRKDYFIYVDEFQNFATAGFETILAEARKYGLSLTVSHQHIAQLNAFNISTGEIEDRVTQALFGNIGTMIVFRIGVKDAEDYFTKELGDPAETEDLENLKNYYAIVKTLINGEVYPPFTIKTVLSPRAEHPSVAQKIKEMSQEKHGRPKTEIEQEIKDRLIQLRENDKKEESESPSTGRMIRCSADLHFYDSGKHDSCPYCRDNTNTVNSNETKEPDGEKKPKKKRSRRRKEVKEEKKPTEEEKTSNE